MREVKIATVNGSLQKSKESLYALTIILFFESKGQSLFVQFDCFRFLFESVKLFNSLIVVCHNRTTKVPWFQIYRARSQVYNS